MAKYVEMKLSEFMVKHPEIANRPDVFPVLSSLLASKDDRYVVRFCGDALEVGYSEDDWKIGGRRR